MFQSLKQVHALHPFLLSSSRSLQKFSRNFFPLSQPCHCMLYIDKAWAGCVTRPIRSIWEMEAGRLGFKSQSWLPAEFKANLGCLRFLYGVWQPKTQSLCAPTPGHPSYQYVMLSMSLSTVVVRCCWCSTLLGVGELD